MKSPLAPSPFLNRAIMQLPLIAIAFVFTASQLHITQAATDPTPNTTPADEVAADLIQVVQKQAVAWNRGDLAEFMSPYWKDERLTFSSSGKTKRGWQATYENYKKNYPDSKTMGKLTFSELETQELGSDAMLMLGTWHLDREEPVGGNFSLVWKRIDGKWVIVHDHSSALKP